MNRLELLACLENNDELHLSRLLLLLRRFAGRKGTGTIDGLTKLAKLDFLLRYPVYLERALETIKASTQELEIQEHERKSVESRMIRFRYGPWDSRYRRFINLLIAQGLAYSFMEGRTIKIGLTDKGIAIAEQLEAAHEYADIFKRAKIIKHHFDIGATKLMNFVYEVFPELSTMRMGEEIR